MKIVHFADLHLGVESYGRIDPSTGLSSRISDFLKALDKLVDYAEENQVDLVLFCGDAYKNREPTQTQQREFAKRIDRLTMNGISVFLLVGNHDLPNAEKRAASTEIFGTLSLKNVFVAHRPGTYHIPTKSGDVEIVALPWLRRSALISSDNNKSLTLEELNQRAQEILTNIIAVSTAELDPALPTILAAHVWVVEAKTGSERSMTIGQEHALLKSNVAHPAFDYVALGHIHKHQVLSKNPPVVYAGSLERVDFGEAGDEKGFYVVNIETDPETERRKTSYSFHPIEGRRFLAIEVAVEAEDPHPTQTILNKIEAQDIKDAVVRLHLSLPTEAEAKIQDAQITAALADAHYFTVAKEVERRTRLRLGGQSAEEITPLDALKAYLETQKLSAKRAKAVLKHGKQLIQERDEGQGY